MKKGILILLGMFMMVSTVEAKKGNNLSNNNRFYYSYNNAVNFIERDVEFFIFPNGEFDFDVLSNNRFNLNIDRNFRGQIRRIGTVRIFYDRFNNVTRIGNIFLNYRRGRLISVGNLRVNYNRWNEPIFSGFVRDNYYFDNGVRFNLNLGVTYNFNDRFFFRNDFNRNYRQIREDRNFFYYKANRTGNKSDHNRIIKRRKSVASNSRRNNTFNERSSNNRSSNNSYRKSTIDNNKNTSRRKSTIGKENDVNRRKSSAIHKPEKRVKEKRIERKTQRKTEKRTEGRTERRKRN